MRLAHGSNNMVVAESHKVVRLMRSDNGCDCIAWQLRLRLTSCKALMTSEAEWQLKQHSRACMPAGDSNRCLLHNSRSGQLMCRASSRFMYVAAGAYLQSGKPL